VNCKDGIIGLIVGDALGVPVEFQDRATRNRKPVSDMMAYGTHNQPAGTWSDDSSLALCLTEQLCVGYDLNLIAEAYTKWYNEALWTSYGRVFDIGNTTRTAIASLNNGVSPADSGGRDVASNGNGSLMCILPAVYYPNEYLADKLFMVHDISSITHAHPRSKIACGLYIIMLSELLSGKDRLAAYHSMVELGYRFYIDNQLYDELPHFNRILDGNISNIDIDEIQSDGYVIHTLEAALWTFLKYDTYKESVLAAINLGGDTDTTGAVIGGLAGVYYGLGSIPSEWIDSLARIDDIMVLCDRYNNSIALIRSVA